MDMIIAAHTLFHLVVLWASAACQVLPGVLRCDCNTDDCINEGRTYCLADNACYSERFQNRLTKGCDPNGLACENRKPERIAVAWPLIYCCSQKDFCNQALPELMLKESKAHEDSTSGTNRDESGSEEKSDCQNSSNSPPPARVQGSLINPIYVAVPVAGVCVLLALIIFAIYLLRRRTDYYHHQPHAGYHYNAEHMPPLSEKQTENVVHHCHCTCAKQTLPPCHVKGNRCPDSERSSSGSETRLFINN